MPSGSEARSSGLNYQGPTLRARIIHLRGDAGLTATQVLIFHHGDPDTDTALQSRRSFLVPIGVPDEAQVLDTYRSMFNGDLDHRKELAPMLLWQVASRCWLPSSPEVVTSLADAMITTCRALETEALQKSKTFSAARLMGGKGSPRGPKGGTSDRFYTL